MILLLLVLLKDANEEAMIIFNTLNNDKKLVLLKLFKRVFIEEFDKEIALYEIIYRDYENKRVELEILHEFGIKQNYIDENSLFFNEDLQINTDFAPQSTKNWILKRE